MVGYVATA